MCVWGLGQILANIPLLSLNLFPLLSSVIQKISVVFYITVALFFMCKTDASNNTIND